MPASNITAQEMADGLATWVAHYKLLRRNGNTTLAKKVRDNIRAVIKAKSLDPAVVWGADPDRR